MFRRTVPERLPFVNVYSARLRPPVCQGTIRLMKRRASSKHTHLGIAQDPASILDGVIREPRANHVINLLPQETLARFVLWCAKRVLPIFEAVYPGVLAPRQLIRDVEAFLDGDKKKKAKIERGCEDAWELTYQAHEASHRWATDSIQHFNYQSARYAASIAPRAAHLALGERGSFIVAEVELAICWQARARGLSVLRATDEMAKELAAMVEHLRPLIRESCFAAELAAQEHDYPTLTGEFNDVVEATLLREKTRQKVVSLPQKKLSAKNEDRMNRALAQIAEVSTAAEWLKTLGRGPFQQLWQIAARTLRGQDLPREWERDAIEVVGGISKVGADFDPMDGVRQMAKDETTQRSIILHLIPNRERRLFAAWCASFVLPLYEDVSSKDSRPRKAIEATRHFAERGRTFPGFQEAINGAIAVVNELYLDPGRDVPGASGAALCAYHAGHWAAFDPEDNSSLYAAIRAWEHAVHTLSYAPTSMQDKFNIEDQKELHRLLRESYHAAEQEAHRRDYPVFAGKLSLTVPSTMVRERTRQRMEELLRTVKEGSPAADAIERVLSQLQESEAGDVRDWNAICENKRPPARLWEIATVKAGENNKILIEILQKAAKSHAKA